MEVEVAGGSSPVTSVPDNAVWWSPKPVAQYVFLPSAGRLAADSSDGPSWRRQALPGRQDRAAG